MTRKIKFQKRKNLFICCLFVCLLVAACLLACCLLACFLACLLLGTMVLLFTFISDQDGSLNVKENQVEKKGKNQIHMILTKMKTNLRDRQVI